MIRGFYTAASGMIAQRHRMDSVSNNLANVDLTGYKRDVSVSKAFPEMLMRRLNDDGLFNFPMGSLETAPTVGKLGTGVEHNEVFTVFEQGSLKETSNPFDLALEDQGFFTVKTPKGERYTRNGAFTLGKEGLLMTKDGYPVLTEEGNSIHIKKHNFKIDELGRISHNLDYTNDDKRLVQLEENSWQNEEILGTLKIVRFPKERFLVKEGNSLYNSSETSGQAYTLTPSNRPQVQQGFIETSNVSAVSEMVRMIEVNRAYEANQKTLNTQDELLGKLINEVARQS